MSAARNLFVQGPRGAGKTTLLFRVIRRSGMRAGGFVVKKVYRNGRRAAMAIVDLLTGQRDVLVSFEPPGAVVVNSEAFRIIGVPALVRALRSTDIVVMDELGRFELPVPEFLDVVRQALNATPPVVGVLKDEANPFLDEVRARADVVTLRMDRDSREEAGRRFGGLFQALVSDVRSPGMPSPAGFGGCRQDFCSIR